MPLSLETSLRHNCYRMVCASQAAVIERGQALHKLSLHGAAWIRELIRASVRTSCEPHFLHRLHCVLLIAEDRSCYEVAQWFGENPRTIQRWVHAFHKDGMKGLYEHPSGGRRAWLTDEQMQCLTADLQKLPRVFGYPERGWGGKLLAQHVEDCYGIKLSVRQCQRIIHKLVHPKASVNSNSMRRQF